MPDFPARLIAVGGSAGSLIPLFTLLAALPHATDCALVVCLHSDDADGRGFGAVLAARSAWPVTAADAGYAPIIGRVHFARGRRHLVIASDGRFACPDTPPVHFCQPSLDVLFHSVAAAFAARAVGVLLSGANRDGAAGLARIRAAGGTALVQSPASAGFSTMPGAAIALGASDHVAAPAHLAAMLSAFARHPAVRGAHV